MWSTWEPKKLDELIERHKKVNQYLKAKKQTKGFCVLCLIDDWADAGDRVMHSSTNALTGLVVCGRHTGCACWLLSQKTRVISLICRTNFCWMLFWRMRNAKELAAIIEELDALGDRKRLWRCTAWRPPTNTVSSLSICSTNATRCSTRISNNVLW